MSKLPTTPDSPKLTDDQLEILRHMLGAKSHIRKKDWGYRNYFNAEKGHSDEKTLLELHSTYQEAQFPDLVGMLIALVEDRQGHRLAGRVEEAKIALSEAPQTEFRFVTRDAKLETPITIEQLHTALEGATASIAAAIGRTLVAAGVPGSRIDTLILTGGSTRVPAVGNMLRGLFPEAKAVETDAFGSVGLGLALDAARRFS